MHNRKTFLFALAIFVLAIYGIAIALGANSAGYFWCPDLDDNGYVDFHDFIVFASNWYLEDYCVHGDFDDNQIVDFNDMAFFASYWLADVIDDGNCPCAKSLGSMSSSSEESQSLGCGCGSAKSAMKRQPLNRKPRELFIPGEVIVCFKPEVARGSVNDLATNFNCSVVRRLQRRNVYILQIPVDKTEEQVIELLKKRPDVIYAERHAYVYPDGQLIPNDPNFHRQWNLHQDSDADIDAPEGWYEIEQKFGRIGDPNIVIAVIDTGVDYNHPDLAAAMWTDSFGNFGYDFVNSDDDPMDDSGHGTHVAGIAAAVTNNSIGVAGVAWDCNIMAIKVLPCFGPGCFADLADAIDYAVVNGAHVINMSLGTDYNSVLVGNAVQDAYDANVVLVAAAGNDANNLDIIEHYPSGYPEVICVSATDSNDQLASYSNYGSDVDFAAPGGDIMTEHTGCWWLAPEVTTCEKQIYSTMWDDTYAYMHGTSMATPHVSGLAALCLSTCPELSAQKVKDCIINGVDDLGPPGKDDYYGWGRINLGRTFDYNVCDANYFCANWSNSLGSAPSCAKLIKVSDGCWMGAFEYGQKAGEFVVLTYHTCCGWHGWYGSSSCDYSNDPISGKTWSKSLSCNGGSVQLTDDSTGEWEKIEFTPTDDPEDCCIEYGVPCPYCPEPSQTPLHIKVDFSGISAACQYCNQCPYYAYDVIHTWLINPNNIWTLTQNPTNPCEWIFTISNMIKADWYYCYTDCGNLYSTTYPDVQIKVNKLTNGNVRCRINIYTGWAFYGTGVPENDCLDVSRIDNSLTECPQPYGYEWKAYGGFASLVNVCCDNASEWSSLTYYEVGDCVLKEDSCYKCIVACEDEEPPNPTYWILQNWP